MDDETQLTVTALIEILKTMPADALVYAHDLDTDWSKRVMVDGVWYGVNRVGRGEAEGVTIKAEDY